jgi:hypothetical protein
MASQPAWACRSIAGHESLFNIVFSVYEFARLIFYDMKLKNCASL